MPRSKSRDWPLMQAREPSVPRIAGRSPRTQHVGKDAGFDRVAWHHMRVTQERAAAVPCRASRWTQTEGRCASNCGTWAAVLPPAKTRQTQRAGVEHTSECFPQQSAFVRRGTRLARDFCCVPCFLPCLLSRTLPLYPGSRNSRAWLSWIRFESSKTEVTDDFCSL